MRPLWALSLTLVWTANVLWHRFAVDSAFLDQRIGRNLANGLGWSWSGAPAASDVSHSPLAVVFSAAATTLGLDPLHVMQALGWAVGGALLLHLWLTMERWQVPRFLALAGAFSLASSPILGAWGTGGGVDMLLAATLWGACWSWGIRPRPGPLAWIIGPLLVGLGPLGPLWCLLGLCVAVGHRLREGWRLDLPLPEGFRRTNRTLLAPMSVPIATTLIACGGLLGWRMQTFGTPIPWALLTVDPPTLRSPVPASFAALTLVAPMLWGLAILLERRAVFWLLMTVTTALALLFAAPDDPLARSWLPVAAPGVFCACLWSAGQWRARHVLRAVGMPLALLLCVPLALLELPTMPRGLRQAMDPRPDTPRVRTERDQWRVVRDGTRDQQEVGAQLMSAFGPGAMVVSGPGARAMAWRGPVHDASGRAEPALYAERDGKRRIDPVSFLGEQPVVLLARLFEGTRRQATLAAARMAKEGTVGQVHPFDDERWLLVLRPAQGPARPIPSARPPDLDRLMRAGPSDGSHREERGGGGVTSARPSALSDHGLLVTAGDQAAARVLDLRGNELHRWQIPWSEAWPDQSPAGATSRYLRRAWMLPEGDLLALFEGMGLVRVDRQGQVRWRVANAAHGDGAIMGDRMVVIARTKGADALEEHLQILDLASGELLEDWPLAPTLSHTEVALAEAPDPMGAAGLSRMPEGALLLSLRSAGALLRVDLDAHSLTPVPLPPDTLPQHALQTADGLFMVDAPADPQTHAQVWHRPADGEWSVLYTLPIAGPGSARLAWSPPGVLWISDAADGTISGVGPKGQRVWSYQSPWRVRSGRRVAAVFQAEHIGVEELSWLTE